jgi:outer membrane protein TolC
MNKLLILFSALFVTQIHAQELLTPGDAVQISLQNNFDILIAANNAKQDSIMNSPGQAGMLPSVYLTGGISKNQNNLTQRFTNGNEIISPNAGGTNVNAGVALSWTLFDGMKMFVTKEKLEQIQAQGDFLFRWQVLNTSADVLIAYYDVVRMNLQLKATDEIIRYNEERVKITESRFKAGMGPKTDLLQAKIDLNTQKQVRLDQVLALGNAKRSLNALLSRDALIEFQVADSIPLPVLANRAELEQKMYNMNPGLLALKTQVNVASLTYRETRTQYFPTVIGSAGYNYVRNQNTAGFTLYNQAYGWNAGLSLSMPLYTGGSLRRQSQINHIEMQNADFMYQDARMTAKVALLQAINLYDTRMSSLTLERESEALAKENMNLSLERLRLGQGTALEVAQAQASLADVLYRLAGIQYEAKNAEINVHRQAADL